MNDTFRVRDGRNFGLFIIEDELIDKYGSQIGVYGVAVYAVLARHANGASEAIMSAPAIAARLGCGDRKVRDVLQQLEELKLIARSPNHDEAGGRTADTIMLTNITPLHHMQGPPAPHAPKITTTTGGGALDAPAEEKSVVRVWEEETRTPITPLVADELHDLVDTYGYGWVVDAIREAVTTLGPGRFNVKYIARILDRWQREGKGPGEKPQSIPDDVPPEHRRQWKVLT